MAKGNFDICLKAVVAQSGGYRDSPNPSNLGVTRFDYEMWIGYGISEKIMRGLTLNHVKAFYKVRFWDPAHCDNVYAGLDLCLFDFAIEAGSSVASKCLQQLLGANDDGFIGPKTASLASQYASSRGINYAIMKYQDMRRDHCKHLKSYQYTEKETLARIKKIEKIALSLAPKTLVYT